MSDDNQSTAPKPARRPKKRGHTEINVERCKGCGFCVAFCPAKCLMLSQDFNRKGYHYPEVVDLELCRGCDMCGMLCPDFAIHGIRGPH
jgi:2-oxoglutarate ferredoxin oxidoreductase subunit delta